MGTIYKWNRQLQTWLDTKVSWQILRRLLWNWPTRRTFFSENILKTWRGCPFVQKGKKTPKEMFLCSWLTFTNRMQFQKVIILLIRIVNNLKWHCLQRVLKVMMYETLYQHLFYNSWMIDYNSLFLIPKHMTGSITLWGQMHTPEYELQVALRSFVLIVGLVQSSINLAKIKSKASSWKWIVVKFKYQTPPNCPEWTIKLDVLIFRM